MGTESRSCHVVGRCRKRPGEAGWALGRCTTRAGLPQSSMGWMLLVQPGGPGAWMAQRWGGARQSEEEKVQKITLLKLRARRLPLSPPLCELEGMMHVKKKSTGCSLRHAPASNGHHRPVAGPLRAATVHLQWEVCPAPVTGGGSLRGHVVTHGGAANVQHSGGRGRGAGLGPVRVHTNGRSVIMWQV